MQSSPDSAPGVRRTQSIVLPPCYGRCSLPAGPAMQGSLERLLKGAQECSGVPGFSHSPDLCPLPRYLKCPRELGLTVIFDQVKRTVEDALLSTKLEGKAQKRKRGTRAVGRGGHWREGPGSAVFIYRDIGVHTTVPTLSENKSVNYVILNDFIPVWSDISLESLQPRWQVLCRAQAYPTDSLWWVAEWKPQASLSNPAATDHWWLLSTWNVVGPKWDVL